MTQISSDQRFNTARTCSNIFLGITHKILGKEFRWEKSAPLNEDLL